MRPTAIEGLVLQSDFCFQRPFSRECGQQIPMLPEGLTVEAAVGIGVIFGLAILWSIRQHYRLGRPDSMTGSKEKSDVSMLSFALLAFLITSLFNGVIGGVLLPPGQGILGVRDVFGLATNPNGPGLNLFVLFVVLGVVSILIFFECAFIEGLVEAAIIPLSMDVEDNIVIYPAILAIPSSFSLAEFLSPFGLQALLLFGGAAVVSTGVLGGIAHVFEGRKRDRDRLEEQSKRLDAIEVQCEQHDPGERVDRTWNDCETLLDSARDAIDNSRASLARIRLDSAETVMKTEMAMSVLEEYLPRIVETFGEDIYADLNLNTDDISGLDRGNIDIVGPESVENPCETLLTDRQYSDANRVVLRSLSVLLETLSQRLDDERARTRNVIDLADSEMGGPDLGIDTLDSGATHDAITAATGAIDSLQNVRETLKSEPLDALDRVSTSIEQATDAYEACRETRRSHAERLLDRAESEVAAIDASVPTARECLRAANAAHEEGHHEESAEKARQALDALEAERTLADVERHLSAIEEAHDGDRSPLGGADEIDEMVSAARTALDRGEFENAAEKAEAAFDRITSELQSLSKRELDRAQEVATEGRAGEFAEAAAGERADGEYLAAFRTARKSRRAAVESHFEDGRGHEKKADESLANDEYVSAIEHLSKARERYQRARAITQNGGVDTQALSLTVDYELDPALQRVDSLEEDARAAASEYVDELASTASEAVETADTRFNDGETGAAIERYRDAAETYETALTLTEELSFDEYDHLHAERERVQRRITYCRLAESAERIERAREMVADDPEDAIEQFEAIRARIDEIQTDDEEIAADRDKLLDEATGGWFRARTEAVRTRLRTAEELYGQGDRYEAKAQYETALETLSEIKADISELSIEEFTLHEDLKAVCETNLKRINQELTGVASVSGGGDGASLVRVGPAGGPARQDDTEPSDEQTDVSIDQPSADAGVSSDPLGDESSEPFAGAMAAPVSSERTSDDKMGHPIPDHERVTRLGSGGTATVWHVRLEDGEEAALKLPDWEGTLDQRAANRFLGEAEIWNRIDDHESIVSVLDWGFGAQPWLLMEYMPGGDLSDRVGAMETVDALDVLIDVCAALHYARGIDHLDVKPTNILFDADDRAKVADWGTARVAFDRSEGSGWGISPHYAAPEQIDDTHGTPDHRTDIYQLGVTGYELLTGRLPYDPDAAALDRRILAGDPMPPTELDSELPPDIDETLLQALAVDPADRYEAIIKFRDALAAVRDSLGGSS